MTGLELVVVALAAHRLARLVGFDLITRRLRAAATGYADDGRVLRSRRRAPWLYDLVKCGWCLTVWTSAVVMVVWHVVPEARIVVEGLAVATIAGLVFEARKT